MRIVETGKKQHKRTRLVRVTVAAACCLGAALSKAKALVSLNDGHDKIFVNGTVTFSWDSNIYASKGGQGDYVMAATTGIQYSRRAGLIGVDASVSVNASKYNRFTAEDFRNPSMSIEFTKQTGRMTGSLLFSAIRSSRADPNANLRTQAWTYDAGLKLHYPVIDRYSLSGGVEMTSQKYQNNAELVNLNTYQADVNLFYVYSQERDLLAGVRIRKENTSGSSNALDAAYTFGVNGRIIPKVNGSVRFGYQTRSVSGMGAGNFNSWTADSSVTWTATKRFQVSGTLNKDFNTTSTDASTDVLAGSLAATYAVNEHVQLGANTGAGISRFLGALGFGRKDTYFDYALSVDYSLNDHLKTSFQYTYFRNWSTLAIADFIRQGYSLTIASRW